MKCPWCEESAPSALELELHVAEHHTTEWEHAKEMLLLMMGDESIMPRIWDNLCKEWRRAN